MPQEKNSAVMVGPNIFALMELTFLEFGVLLRAYIGAAGYSSLNSFAGEADTTATTITECCLGKRSPPLDKLEKWAELLGLSGPLRSQFIQAGWRAKALDQPYAKPWIQHLEEQLREAVVELRDDEKLMQWMNARIAQLDAALRTAGVTVPKPERPMPGRDGSPPSSAAPT